ncbi:MAG: hypothetical protein ACT4PV_03570 [Planctomycetaceae bacterium]
MRGLACLLLASAAVAETVVDREGGVFVGAVELRIAEETLLCGGAPRPLDRILLVEREDGTVVFCRDVADRLLAYRVLARRGTLERALALIPEALRLKAGAHARTLFDLAVRAGIPDKERVALERRVKAGEAKKPKAEDAARIGREVAAIASLESDLVVARAVAAPPDDAAKLPLLRHALSLAPDHGGAQALLAELLPATFPFGDGLAWLHWRLDMEPLGFGFADENERELKRARHAWRPDLYGITGPGFLVVTAVRDASQVEFFLLRTRLVCGALEELFATNAPRRKERKPMLLFLHSDRDDYRKHSQGYTRLRDDSFLETSLGHYAAVDEVSRLFRPAGEEADRFASVLAHVVTRHWLMTRNPRYTASEAIQSYGSAGAWVEDGLATLLGEALCDHGKGGIELFNPKAESLDVVRALEGGKGIPWATLLLLNEADVGALSRENVVPVERRTERGSFRYSASLLFNLQAAAICSFLLHDERGARRGRLVDYITNHYRGEGAALNPRTAFDMSADELGRCVERFANTSVGGG